MRDNRGEHGNSGFPLMQQERPSLISPAIKARNDGERCLGCQNYLGTNCLYDADIEAIAERLHTSVEAHVGTVCLYAE